MDSRRSFLSIAPRGGGLILAAEAGGGAVWGADAQGSVGIGVLFDEKYQHTTRVAFAEGGVFAGGPNGGVGFPEPDYSDYIFNSVTGIYGGGRIGGWISNATGEKALEERFQAATFNLGLDVLGGVSVGFAFNFPYYLATLTYFPQYCSIGASFTSYPTWTVATSF